VVQDFDPIAVGAHDLRECLLLQIKHSIPTNTLAQQIVSEYLKQVQSNQLKEIARALNRPTDIVSMRSTHQELRSAAGAAYNKTGAAAGGAGCLFPQGGRCVTGFLERGRHATASAEPDVPPAADARRADKEVRNYVKERFTAAIQLMKNIEQRKHTFCACVSRIIARQPGFLDKGAGRSEADDDQRGAEKSALPPASASNPRSA